MHKILFEFSEGSYIQQFMKCIIHKNKFNCYFDLKNAILIIVESNILTPKILESVAFKFYQNINLYHLFFEYLFFKKKCPFPKLRKR